MVESLLSFRDTGRIGLKLNNTATLNMINVLVIRRAGVITLCAAGH